MTEVPLNHVGYTQYLGEGRLMAARCQECDSLILPPRPLCPECFSARVDWMELSGEGTLEGYSTINVGLPQMAQEGYSREKPYCVGVVKLKEGPSISAQIVGISGECPDQIKVGMTLKATFLRREGTGETVLAFQAA